MFTVLSPSISWRFLLCACPVFQLCPVGMSLLHHPALPFLGRSLCLRTSLCQSQGIFCQLRILCEAQSDAKFAGWCLGPCNIFLLVYPVQVTAWPPELSSLYTNWVQGDGGADTLPLSDCGNKIGKWKELQFQGAGGFYNNYAHIQVEVKGQGSWPNYGDVVS